LPADHRNDSSSQEHWIMRWFSMFIFASSLALVGGCATTRTLTISTKPADAILTVDHIEVGKGPKTLDFAYDGSRQTHVVVAKRMGFKDTPLVLKEDSPEFDRKQVEIELLAPKRMVTIKTNLPAIISIDGKPVNDKPITEYKTELPFTIINKQNEWRSYRVMAEKKGFMSEEKTIENADLDPTYELELKPARKDITINSNPPGAKIFFDNKEVGVAPALIPNVDFPFDDDANDYQKHEIRAEKPGYDPVTKSIGWDEGNGEYQVDLLPQIKTVRIITDPAGATVLLDGKELDHDPAGNAIAEKLAFTPNEKGEPRTYTVDVSLRTPESEWTPQTFKLGWDEGKAQYDVKLKEIRTRNVSMVAPELQRTKSGWQIVAKTTTTLAAKDVNEGANEPPVQVTQFENGTMVDTLGVSPDGSRLVYSLLQPTTNPQELRSRIEMINTDGTGGRVGIDDGQSLDLMPAFTPDGSQIVYSSNRAGRKMNIFSVPTNGQFGVTNLTTGDSTDLWPSVDSEPRQRLYYQGMMDNRDEPHIYMVRLNTILKTDLPTSGMQPRISPRNDSIIFARKNEKTGLRDLWLMSDRGSDARNLTDTPGIEEFDASWNRDGSKIAFTSDRGTDEDGRHQLDIWVLDLARPDAPRRITSNASVDDCPIWDPAGNAIYFRSNRGGSWQIWKIAIK
jgi:Tol biopolymer transport system component